ncbi:hypothetical protein F5Y11DRAFT_366580 [Daldinia sp. FL1419]|nr:hypothetical protein F5Y11DRAFT_366580 [Daldinia sp. FL1419]
MGKSATKKRRERRKRKLVRDRWKSYATSLNMLRFDNCAAKFLSRKRPGVLTSQLAALPAQAGKKQSFGLSGPCDPRFLNRTVEESIPAVSRDSRGFRGLEEVLMDNPSMKFEGISPSSLKIAAKSALQVTEDVTAKWLQKWCPNMDFAEIFDHIRSMDYFEENYTHNLFMVPPQAMDIKATGTTLANLYRNCHRVYSKYPVLESHHVAEVFEQCIIVCSVLKDKKSADLLRETMDVVNWSPVRLGCKKLDVQIKLSDRLDEITATGEERMKSEKALLKLALTNYEIHRQKFSIKIIQQVQKLLESSK